MAGLACALQHLINLNFLSLSHNNIGPDGMTALAHGLLHIRHLHFLDVSHNSIDLEGAKAIITSLKVCHHLYEAVISRRLHHLDEYHPSMIIVHDLLSPDNTAAIAELVDAAVCENQDRILYLGFKSIYISPKGQILHN